MVIFLVGLVSMILMRTLRKDYARYAKEEDVEEMDRDLGDEYGWKQVISINDNNNNETNTGETNTGETNTGETRLKEAESSKMEVMKLGEEVNRVESTEEI